MSTHTPNELLHRFVQGEVDEDVAVAVAMHLDLCPRCATRAAAMEPLAQAFAAIDDPVTPPDLMDSVLRATSKPALPRPEPAQTGLWASAGLLLGALCLLLILGDPADLLAELASALGALDATLGVIAAQVQAISAPALALGAVIWAGATAWSATRVFPLRGAHSPARI